MAVTDAAGEDAQRLMNMLMNFAQQRLKETAGFAPFSAWLGPQSAEAMDTTYVGNEDLSAREITDRLADELRKGIGVGRVRAAAIASDVQFVKQGTDDWRSAVELHIEHESGYCVDIFVPYRVRRGWRKSAGRRVRFSHPVGQESAPRLWLGTHDPSSQ